MAPWLFLIALVASCGPTSAIAFPLGSKIGLSAVGSGFTFAGNYVYTQAQSQAIVNDLNPYWWYTYTLTSNGVTMPRGQRFIPYFGNDMRQTSTSLTPFTPAGRALAIAEAGNDGYIMFGGEIDQAGPPISELIADWNTLATAVAGTRIKLLSPRLGANQFPGDLLDQFIAGVTRKPDGICIDAYAGNPADIPTAFNQIYNRIGTHAGKYPGLPLWIGEFGWSSVDATDQQWFDLWTALIPHFEADERIQAYFHWLGGPATVAAAAAYPHHYLYDDAAVATPKAAFYRTLGLKP